jgi:hypothetical protein
VIPYRKNRLKSGIFRLASEFVVIVLGVLAALGVDEWRGAVKQQEVRELLFAGLISDLEENAADYEEVLQVSRRRLEHCRVALKQYDSARAGELQKGVSIGDMFDELGYYARLETSESTYTEMTTSGTGVAINDIGLRLRITRHYSLARDQADLNEFFEATTRPYHERLRELGYSPADRDDVDSQLVLRDPQIRAILKTMERTLIYATVVSARLIESNQSLQAELRSIRLSEED